MYNAVARSGLKKLTKNAYSWCNYVNCGLSHSFLLQMYPLQELKYECLLVLRLPILCTLSLARLRTSIKAQHVEPEMAHRLATPRCSISSMIYSIRQIQKSPISFRDQFGKFNACQIFPLDTQLWCVYLSMIQTDWCDPCYCTK